MPSIQSSGYPLAFKLAESSELLNVRGDVTDEIAIRTVTRALDGMQKEAVVKTASSASAWRMVCDEGLYLNGTDLAPFPLAFFTAGMAASFASAILALAARRETLVENLVIVQDNRYSLEGSAVKGTMTGHALPVESEVRIKSDVPDDTARRLVQEALALSPADALMRAVLRSVFKITKNGTKLDTGKAVPSATPQAKDPEHLFDGIRPAESSRYEADILTKCEPVGAGSAASAAVGLQPDQKRTIHVRGTLSLRVDGLKSIRVELLRPLGSTFNFLGDDPAILGGHERAPSGLEYLSAGVAFCFMTQLGRYAAIVKQDLASYRIVQDTAFSMPGDAAASAEPVDTQVFITSSADDDANRTLVDMGEQTCYLHAAYRGTAKTRLRIVT